MVERIDRKLSTWKGKYLLLRGRVTLIKSVLSSIPIHFLSCFKCLMKVVKRIERIQCDFLWNDTVEKREHHLVNWNMVCQPAACGRLGIRSLSTVNNLCLESSCSRGVEKDYYWKI